MPSGRSTTGTLSSVVIAAGASILLAASVAVVHELLIRRRTTSRDDDSDDHGHDAATRSQAAPRKQLSPQLEILSRQEWITKFPSLGRAFQSTTSSSIATTTSLVGILFAAGWCDDCQAFVPLLRKFLNMMIRSSDETNQPAAHQGIAIVYVSSDTSPQGMDHFKPVEWDAVPFEQREERIRLKRFMGACAKKELLDAALGMTANERRHGIPTLVLIEPSTGRIVAENGVDLVTDAMQLLSEHDDDDDDESSSSAKMAIDRFWTKLSLLQEQ